MKSRAAEKRVPGGSPITNGRLLLCGVNRRATRMHTHTPGTVLIPRLAALSHHLLHVSYSNHSVW